jgi:electron transport complex protein RnfG
MDAAKAVWSKIMKKILGLVISLTIISAVCAGVLAFIKNVTAGPIEKTAMEKKLSAARLVMPDGVETVEPITWEDAEKKKSVDFAGKTSSGQIIGYAVVGQSPNGYGGNITIMVGFRSDKKTVVCYKSLSHAETSGLGSKLSSDEFSSQFNGKTCDVIKVVKDGGQIEAITSATITSRAVCEAVANAQEKLAAIK